VKNKKIIQMTLAAFVLISVGVAVTKELKRSPNNPVAIKQNVDLKPNRLVAYYFHGNARCPSCLKIERYSFEAIQGKFSQQIKEGKIEWKVVNVDEGPNAHYIQEYKIFTKSLVLSQLKDGKQVHWINCEKIWDLLGDQGQFMAYVQGEVDGIISGS